MHTDKDIGMHFASGTIGMLKAGEQYGTGQKKITQQDQAVYFGNTGYTASAAGIGNGIGCIAVGAEESHGMDAAFDGKSRCQQRGFPVPVYNVAGGPADRTGIIVTVSVCGI